MRDDLKKRIAGLLGGIRHDLRDPEDADFAAAAFAIVEAAARGEDVRDAARRFLAGDAGPTAHAPFRCAAGLHPPAVGDLLRVARIGEDGKIDLLPVPWTGDTGADGRGGEG